MEKYLGFGKGDVVVRWLSQGWAFWLFFAQNVVYSNFGKVQDFAKVALLAQDSYPAPAEKRFEQKLPKTLNDK
jgi:hypothetical protein